MRPPAPLPDQLLRLALRQEGLLSTAQADAAGVGRHRRAALRRDGALVAVVRGVHDAAPALVRRYGAQVFADPFGRPAGGEHGGPAATNDARALAHDGHAVVRGLDHARRRTAWTALLALGPDRAVAVGECALALLGVHGLPRSIRPQAALPSAGGRADRGPARVRRFRTHVVVMVGGARVVGPDLALAQAVCELSREHAVSVLDSAIRLGLVAPDLERVRALARGRRGAARLEAWWSLVDGRADSPLETRARLQCVDAGLAPHELQVPVLDAHGRVVARGDLGWWAPGGRLVVVEIDGAGPHSTPAALYRDRERQNAIVATGATLLRFTASDVAAGRIPAVLAPHLAGPHARRTPGSAAFGPSEPAQPRVRR
ncbi:type IV toxin-antitoxin system AbiEi family antitoxin domain-containing protein [Cellulomonas sp. B6]|uniref:type IV toxin-antitoxin system AbiEi family antitoxin domain-containing protein n=1 Tax=Cellulomonas sp. B6 TaxID=1295626 RepID=UPI00073C9B61|nr:type IV toxin-antitoxin system AbiEi family antitoxin domain-containing protein [Cellulomonas sp. B6]KSW18929.1 hypothetical protein ATM99_00720 [Cellulomonas sp. B6]